MRKIFLLLSVVFFLSITGYSQNDCDKKNMGTVSQYSGVHVFVFSEPVKEYTHLATIKKSIWANDYIEFLQKAAALSKKEHPDCDAIVLHTISTGFKDSWDVIKYK